MTWRRLFGHFRLRDSPREVDLVAGFRRERLAERARCSAIARARRDATIGQDLNAYGVADAIARQIDDGTRTVDEISFPNTPKGYAVSGTPG
jgi:hypothetical protein